MSKDKQGFTLIELLVAMAILGMIVVMCGQIFEQATTSWNTGVRKAEMAITGRGLADFIAQDMSRCVVTPDKPAVLTGLTPSFWVLDETEINASGGHVFQKVTYAFPSSGSGVPTTRNGVMLAPDGMVEAVVLGGDPAKGHVEVTVTVKDELTADQKIFTARAWLANRDRYLYEE